MAPNHGGDPLGSILGPMGSHWGQKMGQNRKKLPCPKTRIFDYSGVIDLGKKSNLRLWLQFTVGNTWGPSWGQWGPIGNKKWVKTVKNYHAPIFDFLTTPRSSIWAKNRINGYGAKSRWGPPRVHFGANCVPLGPKKWVKTVNNYHTPKFEFFTTPRSSIWAKNRINGYGAKSRWGPPRVHLEVDGVPLGPKNGSKP